MASEIIIMTIIACNVMASEIIMACNVMASVNEILH